jgi:hypothetical protein
LQFSVSSVVNSLAFEVRGVTTENTESGETTEDPEALLRVLRVSVLKPLFIHRSRSDERITPPAPTR